MRQPARGTNGAVEIRRRSGHPGAATLHAYAAGEVDPAKRAVIRAHLADCEACAAALEQVEAMRGLLENMAPLDLDELSWQRMRRRVVEDLHQDASEALPVRRRLSPALTAGLAAGLAAAFAGGIVWLAPAPAGDPHSTPDSAPVLVSAPQPVIPTIVSGRAPFELTLASGARLELSHNARIRVLNERAPGVSVELEQGQLAVQLLRTDGIPARADDDFELIAPTFRVVARRSDFSVGYWATEAFVSVRKGDVSVHGAEFGGTAMLKAGERKVVRGSGASPVPERAETKAPVQRRARPTRGARPTQARAESRVEVIAPPQDRARAGLRDASRAFYDEGDPERAVRLAEALTASGGSEASRAHDLLCKIHLSKLRPAAAAAACEAALVGETAPDRIRHLHGRLAGIYGGYLSDCARAIDHYGATIVFGSQTPFEEKARLGRARCALETGALDLARQDLSVLEARDDLTMRSELTALYKRLTALQAGRERGEQR